MKKQILKDIFNIKKPIIGMIHLRALPGSPNYSSSNINMKNIIEIAVKEAKLLEKAGVDGLQIENIWDYPFVKGEEIGHETTASMTAAAIKVKEAVNIPIGINCHLNGGKQALAVAKAVDAKWIRVFEWVNAYISRAGYIEGLSGKLSRYRSFLHAEDIKFLCDVNVKHGSHFLISDRSIIEQAKDAVEQGAESLIITGFETGKAPSSDELKSFTKHIKNTVLIGSGVKNENVKDLLKYADGAIVGSYFKKDGNWKNEVHYNRAAEFMKIVNDLRGEL